MTKENTSAPAAENKMGTMPIGKLLFNMSLPMMISMLVQALYNIVDSIFVAKLSENALTAVSLASLHSTMFLLIPALVVLRFCQFFFTFHYVSINTVFTANIMLSSNPLYIPLCFY